MKKTCILLFMWVLSLPAFSQSSFPNDELILMMTPGSTEADMQALLVELDMYIAEGPTANLGATLLKFNTPPVIPPNGNPNGPITGGKEKAAAESEVTGVGFNFELASLDFSENEFIQENNCYDLLDESTDLNGGNSVLTGIFDTGISTAMPTNNGYYDPNDLGYNVLYPGIDPIDDNGHGSHISSIVMENLENANGAIQLKSYKTHNSMGQGRLFDVMKALDQAISDGVQIVNMSFGYEVDGYYGQEPKSAFKVFIGKAWEMSGMLCIAAAGNQNLNNDPVGLSGIVTYPSSFDLPNVISVASANCAHHKSPFSNFGQNSVDVFAPGENIWGHDKNWNLISMSGTSQATAFVTKLATYLATFQSQFNWYDIKCAILHGTVTAENGYVLTDGHIDVAASLNHLLNVGDCTDYQARLSNDPIISNDLEIKYLPEQDIPTFEISADENQTSEILITNINGEILYKDILYIRKGNMTYQLRFANKPLHGIYFLSIIERDGIKSIKFIR